MVTLLHARSLHADSCLLSHFYANPDTVSFYPWSYVGHIYRKPYNMITDLIFTLAIAAILKYLDNIIP